MKKPTIALEIMAVILFGMEVIKAFFVGIDLQVINGNVVVCVLLLIAKIDP